jgi:hypothetical protein
MISDVLSEALDEIMRYQRDFSYDGDGIREEIEAVKIVMANLQIRLDVAPDPDAEDPRTGEPWGPPAIFLADIPERPKVREYLRRREELEAEHAAAAE